MKIEIKADLIYEVPDVVAYAQALDLCSCGKTEDEAVSALAEAVQLFAETTQDMGTFEQILIESGYVLKGDEWTIQDEPQDRSALRVVGENGPASRYACVES
jgi:hypothetical protein